MNVMDFGQLLRLLWPEITIILAALLALSVDLLALRHSRLRIRFLSAAIIASIGCVIAIDELLHASTQGALLDKIFVSSPLTQLVQIALLVIAILTLFLAVDADFTDHVGEFVLLILLATTGMMFLVAAQDLLVLFLSLELLSLSAYVLAGFDKLRPRSSEAALKYFLFGGMSAAFLLFGFSLLYGLANSTNFVDIACAVQGHPFSPILILAIVTTVIGFGFKLASAPFHFWAPDVYQAAPIPSAAFIASGSKVASFFIFFQLLVLGFAGAEGVASPAHFQSGWAPVLVAVSVVSMILGNLIAITQTSLRRLLAYSAIGHAGYMLLGIIAHSPYGLSALIYYVITYALAALGAFGLLGAMESHGIDRIADLSGLYRRAPDLALCLLVFLLSLAGIPPLSGFFGKFYIFTAALESAPHLGMLWLILLAVAMSAVSLYYYLRVLKYAFVADPHPDAAPLRIPLVPRLTLWLITALIIVLGCAPSLLISWIGLH